MSSEKYGKRRQITFRIGPLAEDRLRQVAALFNMKPSEYAKAVLYRDLGVFNEPLDQRRRSWRQKKEADEETAHERWMQFEDEALGLEDEEEEEES
ncbi:MAG: hypothetical protein QW146_03735 [Candidatus Bathyarchaeia archaeon]